MKRDLSNFGEKLEINKFYGYINSFYHVEVDTYRMTGI